MLKTHPPMFRAVRDGVKNFDVRKDDRAFQTGDTVELVFSDPAVPGGSFPTPPQPWGEDDARANLKRKITFVLRGGQYGVEPGYVVLAMTDAD
jgi:hypothetical protein